MKITLEQIIGHGQFFQKTLLNAESFIRYCKDRQINISLERLEKYEKLGVFLPLARLRYPKIKIKIEPVENGEGYTELGILKDGEEWSGETREEYGGFLWNDETINSLIEDGYLWIPTIEKYESWKNYKDEEGWTSVDSYYSIFQTLPLHTLIQSTTFPLGIENLATWNQENIRKWFRSVKKPSRAMLKSLQNKEDDARYKLAKLGQVLSNRYLPYAEKYEGMISLPHPDFFDWQQYRTSWDAKKVLSELKLTVEEVADFHRLAEMEASSDDPLDHWKDLVKFVSKSKKEQLKGIALLAQTWRVLERTLNLFHRDLTGELLYSYGEDTKTKESLYGKGVPQDDLALLEFVANRYGINPRPKLFLFVEGDGEVEHFPRLSVELFGIRFSEIRIQIQNLYGVGGFEGDKKVDKYGAFEKLIEYYHDKQTIAFFILDKEGRVEKVKQKLITKASKEHPNRTITKDEYIKLWDKNVEFDNFTNKEIAEAMTKLSKNRYFFTETEVEDCRNRFGQRGEGDTLSRLYKDKCSYSSNKIKLLGILIDYAVLSPEFELNGTNAVRPLIKTIEDTHHLAMRNFQPSRLQSWEETQNSEWLGHSI